MKSTEERKAIFNAVDKLRQLGEQRAPPHVKPLKDTRPLVYATFSTRPLVAASLSHRGAR